MIKVKKYYNQLDYDFVKEAFEKRGYKLLEKNYVNCGTKMRFECPKHKDKGTYITYDSLKSGKGCCFCGRERAAATKRYSFDYVKEKFEECGYILNETEYTSVLKPLRYTCPNHPNKQTKISLSKLLNGVRCPYCKNTAKYTFEEAKIKFEEAGYVLLETEYVNNKKPMRYICPVHPNIENRMSLSGLLGGRSCKKCADVKTGRALSLDFDFVKSEFEKKGYVLNETEYINNSVKMSYSCPNHPLEELKISYGEIQSGRGCPLCSNIHNPKGEQRIAAFLKKSRIKFKRQYSVNGCKNIRPLRFDFGVLNSDGTLCCLIEFHGEQHEREVSWFGGVEGFNYRKQNDSIKKKFCTDNDIRLIEIFYKSLSNIEQILKEKVCSIVI